MTMRLTSVTRLVAVCLIAGATVTAASSAVARDAKGVLYDCDMQPSKTNDFWISTKIGIVVLNDGSVVVSDGVSLNYPGGTARAALQRNTDREMRLDWRLAGGIGKSKDREFLLPDAEYSAVIEKPSNRIHVRGWLPEFRKRFSGSGTCTPRVK
ncbi:hypothetical protein [uncultured Roseobacter sp.]|uniref:hypothetical protein n=1 Tax=uncultured Roseobacter sp. TaxID=114847 RepID=UPI00263980A1|nr:hypothetical protein [uncultured Roseobacter sp.]